MTELNLDEFQKAKAEQLYIYIKGTSSFDKVPFVFFTKNMLKSTSYYDEKV